MLRDASFAPRLAISWLPEIVPPEIVISLPLLALSALHHRIASSKVGVALPVLLALSIGLIMFGSFIPAIVVKILVMGMGYTVILFIRDPFKLYVQDVVLESTPKEQHQTLVTVLEFGVKIATAGTGLVFSAILLAYPLAVILAIMFVIAIIEIILGVILYRAILSGRALAEN